MATGLKQRKRRTIVFGEQIITRSPKRKEPQQGGPRRGSSSEMQRSGRPGRGDPQHPSACHANVATKRQSRHFILPNGLAAKPRGNRYRPAGTVGAGIGCIHTGPGPRPSVVGSAAAGGSLIARRTPAAPWLQTSDPCLSELTDPASINAVMEELDRVESTTPLAQASR
jgi:hypothetical protein